MAAAVYRVAKSQTGLKNDNNNLRPKKKYQKLPVGGANNTN